MEAGSSNVDIPELQQVSGMPEVQREQLQQESGTVSPAPLKEPQQMAADVAVGIWNEIVAGMEQQQIAELLASLSLGRFGAANITPNTAVQQAPTAALPPQQWPAQSGQQASAGPAAQPGQSGPSAYTNFQPSTTGLLDPNDPTTVELVKVVLLFQATG
jgi:hypothetical protein